MARPPPAAASAACSVPRRCTHGAPATCSCLGSLPRSSPVHPLRARHLQLPQQPASFLAGAPTARPPPAAASAACSVPRRCTHGAPATCSCLGSLPRSSPVHPLRARHLQLPRQPAPFLAGAPTARPPPAAAWAACPVPRRCTHCAPATCSCLGSLPRSSPVHPLRARHLQLPGQPAPFLAGAPTARPPPAAASAACSVPRRCTHGAPATCSCLGSLPRSSPVHPLRARHLQLPGQPAPFLAGAPTARPPPAAAWAACPVPRRCNHCAPATCSCLGSLPRSSPVHPLRARHLQLPGQPAPFLAGAPTARPPPAAAWAACLVSRRCTHGRRSGSRGPRCTLQTPTLTPYSSGNLTV
ncbi:skin secretory protein xP2-like [Schistocerca cancellata]|uniref:skin secretory protein xP2-like n=1 Tax=Schistocerca cancellata TaxID=274614 RepID=UPI002119689F|nr:skin secretory protein xP2-like [Schistocerca cancellata]